MGGGEGGGNKKKLPLCPISPYFPLVAKWGKMGIARPSRDIPQHKVHIWGCWPKFCFPVTPPPPKKTHFPPFPPIFLVFSNFQKNVLLSFP